MRQKKWKLEIWQQQYIYLLCVTTGFYSLKFDHLDTYFHYYLFTIFILSFLFKGTYCMINKKSLSAHILKLFSISE